MRLAFRYGLALVLCLGLRAAPLATAVVPPAGSGFAQSFTFTFTNSAGWQELTVVNALINRVLDGRQACYVAFVPSSANSGSVFLVDDAGDAGGPYSGMVLPGNGTVQNRQCSISGAGSSVAASGNVLTLTLAIAFTPVFAGNQVIYLSARAAAVNSDWQALGTWNISATPPAGPVVKGMSPARSNGAVESYTFTFTDTNGWQDITVANVLINSAINGIAACYVALLPTGPSSGVIDLVDNAGNAAGPFSSMTLPGAGNVSNGQCTIDGAGSSVSASGNTLKLTLAIAFHPSFIGNQLVFLAARSNTANSDWQAIGSVTVTAFGTWNGYARNAQHTALSPTRSQSLGRIRWQTSVDLDPQFIGDELLIHYGSPLLTAQNTVLVPVKTGATDGFRVEAHRAADGQLQWSKTSDYILPLHSWVPPFGATLTPAARLYYPGAGGTVYFRDQPDAPTGGEGHLAFYGLANYLQNPSSYNSAVFISTPITSDADGNIYFGFQVNGNTPVPLESGIARIGADGQGTWISAGSAAQDLTITQVVQNCAPALNPRLGMLYIAVSDGGFGYLVGLNATTLQPVARVRLTIPMVSTQASLPDNGTSSPTIGPDDDVYFGVFDLGENLSHGWLLHFNPLLTETKTPGAFGWDDTVSLVPSSMVPSYIGSSSYLLMTKYNDYAETGGLGLNRLAILDPNATQLLALNGRTVMKEVMTILGPTPSSDEPGVKEWCINSAAVDPATKSVLANNEDGKLYRWDLTTNTLLQTMTLTPGLGEAYTPTIIGGDGTVYAINNGTLFAVGQ